MGEWERRLALYLMLLWVIGFPNQVWGTKITLLLSDKNKIYELIEQGIRENITGELQELTLAENNDSIHDEIRKFHPDIVVVIGNAAAYWIKNNMRTTPSIMSGIIYQSDPSSFLHSNGLALDFPISSYLKVAHDALPKRKHVGIIYNAEKNPEMPREASDSAAA